MHPFRIFSLVFLAPLLAACTSLAGVDDLQIGGAGGGHGSGGSGGSGGTPGSGGAPATGPSSTTSGPSTSGTSTTSTTSSTSGTSTSTSTTSSSTTSSTSSSSSGGGVTWTELYDGVFGPSGTSSCVRTSGCHTGSQSGFKCGTSKSTCYTGMINAGLVIAGSNASSSPLVKSGSSPLCGLGGGMPKGGTCVTSAEVTEIKAWLAAGAPND